MDAIAAYRRNAKLTLLNPMTLLMRRRSSQPAVEKIKSARDLPDDFDPGIIYGTRHPDWSSTPKRGDQKQVLTPVNGRHLPPALVSPVLAVTPNKLLKVEVMADESPAASAERERRRTPQFTEHFDDDHGEPAKPPVQPKEEKMHAERRSTNSPDPLAAPTAALPRTRSGSPVVRVRGPPPPTTGPSSPMRVWGPPPTTAPPPPAPVVGTTPDPDSDNEGELHSPPDTSPTDGRPRVSLFDHPLSLPHHLMANSSRFSFEGSSATGESTQDDLNNPGRDESQGYDRFDPDDSEAEQEMDLEDMDDEDDDDDDDDDDGGGFERANEGLFGGEITPVMQMGNIGIALSRDSTPDASTPVESHFTEIPEAGELPSMDPIPGTVVPFPGAGGAQMPLSKRIGNPRGYDLSDDSDLDFLEEDGMAGYEDEEDDMYFDDGMIMDNSFQTPRYLTAPETNTGSPDHEETTDQAVTLNPLLAADPRLSLSTVGISSGGAMLTEDGSMSPAHGSVAIGGGAGTANQSFPPFLNPIGGGLGCTQEQAQFYAPDGTMLEQDGTPMALSTLTRSLWTYQREQQRLADAAANSGYESDYHGDYGSQSGYYSVDDDDGGVAGYEDDDDTMVAEANAEALAYDTEFYGQEFGFYPAPPSSSGSIHGDALDEQTAAYLGGYFGTPGGEVLQRPPLLRRPSLTPISERSESSWRNSMVFPVEGWKGLGAQRPLSALSFGAASPADDGEGSNLKRLRRGAWGGSNGSLRSSMGVGAGDGNSPGLSPGMAHGGPGGLGMSPSLSTGVGWYGVGTGMSPTTNASSPLGVTSPSGPGLPSPSGLSAPPGLMSPPGLPAPPGLGSPPGLSHPGSMAMLPTKGSFEEQQLLQMQGRALMRQQQWQGHGQTHYLPQYPDQSVYMSQNGDPQNHGYGQTIPQPQTQDQAQVQTQLTKLSKSTTGDSSYASAVGSPTEDADAGGSVGGRDEEKRQKEVEKWVFGRQGSRGSERRVV